jgi:hypothetical protein
MYVCPQSSSNYLDANAFGVDITCLNHRNNQTQLMQTACRVTKSVCPCGGKVTTDSKFETTSWDWGLQMSLLLPGASFAGATLLLSPRASFLALWSPSAHRWIYAGDAAIFGWTVRTLLLPLREVVRKRGKSTDDLLLHHAQPVCWNLRDGFILRAAPITSQRDQVYVDK